MLGLIFSFFLLLWPSFDWVSFLPCTYLEVRILPHFFPHLLKSLTRSETSLISFPPKQCRGSTALSCPPPPKLDAVIFLLFYSHFVLILISCSCYSQSMFTWSHSCLSVCLFTVAPLPTCSFFDSVSSLLKTSTSGGDFCTSLKDQVPILGTENAFVSCHF